MLFQVNRGPTGYQLRFVAHKRTKSTHNVPLYTFSYHNIDIFFKISLYRLKKTYYIYIAQKLYTVHYFFLAFLNS